MVTEQMEGLRGVATKPAIRITQGDVPAPTTTVKITLFGGHMDGLPVTNLEVPGVWPVITTLEQWSRKDEPLAFIPRRYKICLCFGRVQMDRQRRIRYCLEVERS